ncbi:MAG: class I SAM-dependent methyltransferase [Vicinamibacterales bacterium]
MTFREFLKAIVDPPPTQTRTPEREEPMFPPQTVEDASAWDGYWLQQLRSRFAGLDDIFLDDGGLVDLMRAEGLRTVLCVGNGLSMEPHALCAAGFQATALDLSPFIMDVLRQATPSTEYLSRLLGARALQAGGTLACVAGDLRDETVCAGPYDVVIERRTLQLFPDDQRPAALERVTARLAARGLIVSHSHHGAWRPPSARRHWTRDWFRQHGWKEWTPGTSHLHGQVVHLQQSTG